MGFSALGGSAGLAKVADTGVAGFPLQNATPNILAWTAPNDGSPHTVVVVGLLNVTVLEVGGAVGAAYTDPAGAATAALFTAGQAAGRHYQGIGAGTPQMFVIAPGSTFTLEQTSALTGGAATLYAQLFAE
jgi:hypothetical protein